MSRKHMATTKGPSGEKRLQHEIVRSPGKDDVHEQREGSQHREGVVKKDTIGPTHTPRHRHRQAH